ncbi:MAG TPA: helix-turn-helix domain-containing protein [Actinomycetales bacterium]|nr:helix-turn-helix domain-containing protein [Actinomycetales bacterium]
MPGRPSGAPTERTRPLRADARRNHQQLLTAARDVVLERGPGAPLDEVARRAGVGIGTLYRRFPDRQALLRAVALEALVASRRAAEDALAQESEGFAALTRYLRAALSTRVSAVLPIVLDRLGDQDEELRQAREASAELVQRIVDTAHADGSLHPQVGFADIGTLLVRLARPLPGPVPAALDDQLAHRQLELFVAGLRAVSEQRTPLAGPRLERSHLRAIRDGG